jgi:hypothetical protein
VVKQIAAGDGGRLLVTAALDAPTVDAGEGEEGDACVPVESWLVATRAGSFVREQLLVTNCSRKPPAEWPMELKVMKDIVRYDLDGQDVPSTWVGTTWAEIALDPPRLVAEGATYWNRMQTCPEETVTTREAGFAESVTWRRPARCDGREDVCTPPDALAYLAVPQVKLPPAYEAGGWRSTELGSCAGVVDGTKGHGFFAFGDSAGVADASMRVVLSDARVLYIEAHDDRFTASDKWARADHVEIWWARSPPSYMDGCSGPVGKPTQWGIAVADGAVFLGARGTDVAALPVAERAESGGVVRLRVQLPPAGKYEFEGLTVAYSDSDDGKTQKSIVATSKIVFGRLETLGRITKVKSSSCAVTAGRLDAVRTSPEVSKRLWPTHPR